jgi:hypothetical protein
MSFLGDRISRLPRRWSNDQLRRIGPWFTGDVVNVSGWRDEDKQGGRYRDYFSNATSYSITNYRAEARGFQGNPGEIFLDLTQPLPSDLVERFDVVFNHTTLEHIYECQVAFANLARMTRDVVIAVVPFVQEFHSDYGDYWRFTPLTMERLYADNHMTMVHCAFNEHWVSSVYLFAVGTKHPERWRERFSGEVSVRGHDGDPVGGRVIPHAFRKLLRQRLSRRHGR